MSSTEMPLTLPRQSVFCETVESFPLSYPLLLLCFRIVIRSFQSFNSPHTLPLWCFTGENKPEAPETAAYVRRYEYGLHELQAGGCKGFLVTCSFRRWGFCASCWGGGGEGRIWRLDRKVGTDSNPSDVPQGAVIQLCRCETIQANPGHLR